MVIKFEELPLYVAAWKVYSQTENHGSDDWPIKKRDVLCQRVLHQLVEDGAYKEFGIPWGPDRIIDAWMNIRKSPEGKTAILCEVAVCYGQNCFYQYRGLGRCSGEIELDRILPGSRDGKYTVSNCVISCSFHNRSRGNLSIENFINRIA